MKLLKKGSTLFIFFALVFGFSVFAQEKNDQKDKGLSGKHKKWLEEEVIYIISDNEKDVFKSLKTDEERENFIKLFWNRRDPTPETPFNEYREEHYRRITYANEHYFEGRTGWRTDRGRTYIMFGPPDFFESNPGGGRGFLLGANAPTAEFSSEVWVYRNIAGLKTQSGWIELMFVNYYNAGSYQLTTTPGLANALRNVSLPARYAGYTDMPTKGPPTATKMAQEIQKIGESPMKDLQLLAELNKSRGEVLEELERSTRLTKLKGFVESKGSTSALSFLSRQSYFVGNDGQTYVPLSIEVAAANLGFQKSGDRYLGMVNYYIEVKNEKGTVYQASDRLEMKLKEETYQRRFSDYYQYKHGFTVKPGEYMLHLVLWDEFNGNVGYIDKKITVPQFFDKEFSLSDVILARDIRVVEVKPKEMIIESKDIPAVESMDKSGLKVPEKIRIDQTDRGPFTFENLEVNPNTLASYSPGAELVFFYQIYNPQFDEEQKGARIWVEHRILKQGRVVAAIDKPRETLIPTEMKTRGLNSGAKFTLSAFEPGNYTLQVRVKDMNSGKMLEKTADFTVK